MEYFFQNIPKNWTGITRFTYFLLHFVRKYAQVWFYTCYIFELVKLSCSIVWRYRGAPGLQWWCLGWVGRFYMFFSVSYAVRSNVRFLISFCHLQHFPRCNIGSSFIYTFSSLYSNSFLFCLLFKLGFGHEGTYCIPMKRCGQKSLGSLEQCSLFATSSIFRAATLDGCHLLPIWFPVHWVFIWCLIWEWTKRILLHTKNPKAVRSNVCFLISLCHLQHFLHCNIDGFTYLFI